ncbi:MAG: cbb3-type cytochrome oxidase assembly protein CcoS [Perlucidibaca sp.]
MEVIYLLIPLSLVFLVVAIYFFFWAVKSEQYEDLEGPAHRIILDDRDERSREPASRPDEETP